MNAKEPRATATILAFAPRPRKGNAIQSEASKPSKLPVRGRIAAYDSWYHQAAVDEERSRPN